MLKVKYYFFVLQENTEIKMLFFGFQEDAERPILFLSSRTMLKVTHCFFVFEHNAESHILFFVFQENADTPIFVCNPGKCWKSNIVFCLLGKCWKSNIVFFVFCAKELYWVTWVLFGSARKYVFNAMHLIYGIKSKGKKEDTWSWKGLDCKRRYKVK